MPVKNTRVPLPGGAPASVASTGILSSHRAFFLPCSFFFLSFYKFWDRFSVRWYVIHAGLELASQRAGLAGLSHHSRLRFLLRGAGTHRCARGTLLPLLLTMPLWSACGKILS